MNLAGRMLSRTGCAALPDPLGPHQVLGVGDADDVVDPVLLDRDAAVAGGQRRLERVAHGGVGLDRHHVGPRRHDLAGHRVAEVDDGVDEGALVLLDHVLLVRHVGHGLELGVGDVGVRACSSSSSPVAPMMRLARPMRSGESQRIGREADRACSRSAR